MSSESKKNLYLAGKMISSKSTVAVKLSSCHMERVSVSTDFDVLCEVCIIMYTIERKQTQATFDQ